MGRRKLPEDYRLDALAVEARRREEKLGRPYSYGQLVADTTEYERDLICDEYRARKEDNRTNGK